VIGRLCLAWVVSLVAFWLVATLCLWEWMLDDCALDTDEEQAYNGIVSEKRD